MPLALLAVAVVAFGIGTTEFVTTGFLGSKSSWRPTLFPRS
ncbi:putative MFS family arabinose efflux permease [Streptomyces tendae]